MMQVFNCQQGTPEWHSCRLGIPTASMFGTVLAKGKDGGASLTRKTYLYKLAGEILTGEPAENYQNDHMIRGQQMEAEARDLYAFMTDLIPQQVGFIRNGAKGCSPDSLIGADGVLEVKSKLPHLAIECLLRGEFPAELKAQCQGALWVTEREWVDIAVYWKGLPLFIKRAGRDVPYIHKLSDAVNDFNEELAEIVERVKRYGMPMEKAA